MLTAFTIENYRSFAQKTRIELRPLTLLFGYNNSGKSALVRALPLFADSMRPDATGPLNLESDAVRGNIFGELVSKIGDSATIRLGLEYEGGLAVEYEVTRPMGSLQQSLTSTTIAHPTAGSVVLELIPGPGLKYQLRRDGKPTDVIVHDPFRGLAPGLRILELPDADGIAPLRDTYHTIIGDLTSASYALGSETLWLGSLRHYPDRFVRMRGGGAPPKLHPDGKGVAEILALNKLTGEGLLQEISAWYERDDCFKRRLNVIQSPDDLFSVVLELLGGGRSLQINVADMGEGIAQVLPVLVAAATARREGMRRPRLLAFEQPELHLHSAVHAPLAEHLCKLAATDRPPNMLIETHSENFLLGVQLQIAKKALPPDRVLVYWVYQNEDGTSSVQRIELDEEGFARGFPDQVFDKDVELSRDIFKARENPAR